MSRISKILKFIEASVEEDVFCFDDPCLHKHPKAKDNKNDTRFPYDSSMGGASEEMKEAGAGAYLYSTATNDALNPTSPTEIDRKKKQKQEEEEDLLNQ